MSVSAHIGIVLVQHHQWEDWVRGEVLLDKSPQYVSPTSERQSGAVLLRERVGMGGYWGA